MYVCHWEVHFDSIIPWTYLEKLKINTSFLFFLENRNKKLLSAPKDTSEMPYRNELNWTLRMKWREPLCVIPLNPNTCVTNRMVTILPKQTHSTTIAYWMFTSRSFLFDIINKIFRNGEYFQSTRHELVKLAAIKQLTAARLFFLTQNIQSRFSVLMR